MSGSAAGGGGEEEDDSGQLQVARDINTCFFNAFDIFGLQIFPQERIYII